METKRTYKVFRFESNMRWKSGRHGVISLAGKPDLDISSPPEFGGKPGFWSPEDLFVATVNACLMQTFMAFALRTDLALLSYESAAEGVLERAEGRYRFTEFNIRPLLVLKSEKDVERARTILDSAEAVCLISESIRATVKVFPEFRVALLHQKRNTADSALSPRLLF